MPTFLMNKMLRSSFFLLFMLVFASQIHAQINPTLSVQGILKKANGVAVEDNTYNITFRLYTVETGGTAIWSENQTDVEVSSGIYSATLGVISPLNVPFNQLYYLGVTVGSAELTPRILLTSAPYALSLIGQSNKFPSSGKVIADSILVNGGVLARGGAPGLNGVSKNGYAFTGNGGDKDSGLFSTADGKVALYANNTEILSATPTLVQSNTNLSVTGSVATTNLTLPTGGKISYNGQNDWRLVETDYLENDAEGWQVHAPVSGGEGAWRNASGAGATVNNFGDFAGKALLPANNDNVFKKQFNLSAAGAYTYVKVVFNYYEIDTWDGNDENSLGWAAFANNVTGTSMRVGWQINNSFWTRCHNLNNTEARNASNFEGNANESDQWTTGEMVARYPSSTGTNFWVFFGYANDENNDVENFAVGSIEIWVK